MIDNKIIQDAEEVLDFIRPFYETFYSSVEPLNIKSRFRGEDCRITTNYTYTFYKITYPYPEKTNVCTSEYTMKVLCDHKVVLENVQIIHLSYIKNSRSGIKNYHSQHLNFPAFYKLEKKIVTGKSHNYHGIPIATDKWCIERNLTEPNWTEADYIAFCFEKNIK